MPAHRQALTLAVSFPTPPKMTQTLLDIFQLEDSGQYDKAFLTYNEIYSKNKKDYDIWKHFYFFLWLGIEDLPSDFVDKINLRLFLQLMFQVGKLLFSKNADFNFIAGYTVSLFPYEYGDYNDLEKEGKQMLLEATRLEPGNLIYKMVYLGSISTGDKNIYGQAATEASLLILNKFNGKGSLNRYFKEVLHHSDDKAYR